MISATITAAFMLTSLFPSPFIPSNFQLQLQSLVVVWESSFLWDRAVTVPVQPDSFGITPNTKLPAPRPFSLLSCPFLPSQIFLQPCLIGALLSLSFFGLPPCQSNAIRPGAGANPLLWLLLLTNPRPKIPKSQWSGKSRDPGERERGQSCGISGGGRGHPLRTRLSPGAAGHLDSPGDRGDLWIAGLLC